MRRSVRIVAALAAAVVVAVAGVTGWAAFTPLAPGAPGPQDLVHEIPKGTYARRMAGEKLDILPDTIRLTLGVQEALLIRNLDDVPQLFGPVLIMPGQSFRLPFEKPATYSFACSAHASGQLAVIVDPAPGPGWTRLRWRMRQMLDRTS